MVRRAKLYVGFLESDNTKLTTTPVYNDPNVYEVMFWLVPISFSSVLWCVAES